MSHDENKLPLAQNPRAAMFLFESATRRRESTIPKEYRVYVEVYKLAESIGAYHSEVVIEGGKRPLQFMFGAGKSGSGVVAVRRRGGPALKERIDVGAFRMTPVQLQAALDELSARLSAALARNEKLSRGAGYECHFIGKGHLGYETTDHLPIRRGFASHLGFLLGSESYYHGGGAANACRSLSVT